MSQYDDLPHWRSHKEVAAIKLERIERLDNDRWSLHANDKTIIVSATWYSMRCSSRKDDDLGYYVVYRDGYTSWSPTEVFEEGYTAISPS